MGSWSCQFWFAILIIFIKILMSAWMVGLSCQFWFVIPIEYLKEFKCVFAVVCYHDCSVAYHTVFVFEHWVLILINLFANLSLFISYRYCLTWFFGRTVICHTYVHMYFYCGILQVPEAEMPYLAGYEETGFLNNLHVTIDDIEFLADNCTKVRIFWLVLYHYLHK